MHVNHRLIAKLFTYSCDFSGSKSTPLTSDNQEILTSKEMYNFEKSNIERALIQCNGRVSGKKGAAEKLGIKPTTLYSRLRDIKININDFSKTMSQ